MSRKFYETEENAEPQKKGKYDCLKKMIERKHESQSKGKKLNISTKSIKNFA